MTDNEIRLSAYLDKQMTAEEAHAFELELRNTPDLASLLEERQRNDQLMRGAFHDVLDEPLDSALLARMGLKDQLAEYAANDNIGIWQKWRWPVGGALAASVALLVALQMGRSPVFDPAIGASLDRAASGKIASVANGRSVMPRLSFKAKDGRLCREFVTSEKEQANTGIACRGSDGWSLEASVAGGSVTASPEKIVAASGEDGERLDATYKKLGASDPLTAEEERLAFAEIGREKETSK